MRIWTLSATASELVLNLIETGVEASVSLFNVSSKTLLIVNVFDKEECSLPFKVKLELDLQK